MKFFRLFSLFIFIICLGNIQAEDNAVGAFFERLQTPQNGTSVRIHQDNGVVQKMQGRQTNVLDEHATTLRTAQGFRVQVFSSNTPRTARTEAQRIESLFKNNRAEAPVYTSFAAPFWKVRVGDCRTCQDAVDLMQKLKAEFPRQSSQMFIVRENVRIMM